MLFLFLELLLFLESSNNATTGLARRAFRKFGAETLCIPEMQTKFLT
jgi:hypothetical protein